MVPTETTVLTTEAKGIRQVVVVIQVHAVADDGLQGAQIGADGAEQAVNQGIVNRAVDILQFEAADGFVDHVAGALRHLEVFDVADGREAGQTVTPHTIARTIAVEYSRNAFFVQTVGFGLRVVRTGGQTDFHTRYTEKLLDALEALIGNSVGTVPDDSSVEIHEASGKASSVDAYDKLIRYCRSEINIALLGQDQTTEKDSTHASATAGLEVTDDIRDGDTRIVEAAYNQLIKWIVGLNFGDVASPKFVLFENEESGTKERAERDKLMTDAGAKFSNQYWQRTYGLEDGDLLDEAQTTAETKAVDFAESDLTDAGLVIDGLAPDTGRLNTQGERLTAVLVAELRQGKTVENLLDHLTAAYPDMDDSALQEELARLIFLAELVGRVEAAQELKA